MYRHLYNVINWEKFWWCSKHVLSTDRMTSCCPIVYTIYLLNPRKGYGTLFYPIYYKMFKTLTPIKALMKYICTDLWTMDWQLPDIGKMITNNILPSILSAHMVSIWRFHSVSIGRFRHCINMLKSVVSVNFHIRSRRLPEFGDYTWPNTHPKYNWCHQNHGMRV